jgi:hypothetical protein
VTTALATLSLLGLVVWMDGADVSAETAAWVMTGVLAGIAVVGLVASAWRT